MILKALKYLFYFFYKITSINYGKEGGVYAAFIIISIFFSINALTLVGLFKKLILRNYNISLLELGIIFFLMLGMSFLIFIFKSRYKELISDFETDLQKSKKRPILIAFYIVFSFLTLALTIII
jgi:hypothetical protein